MLINLKRNIIIALIFAFIVLLALTFFSDLNSIISAIRKFPLKVIPILLLLSSLNLFFRFLKWHYYIRELKINISFFDSLIIFSSGLVMSVTPGKWGEFLKSYLVKYKSGTAISETIPIVISERITDIFSLIIFAILGAYIYNYGVTLIYSIAIVYLILAIIILNRKISLKFLNLIRNIKFLTKYYSKIDQLNENLYKLFNPKIFSITMLYSFASWLFEFFGFYIILRSFTINISVMLTSFIYSFATVIGSLSMLPGGLGATEGSLTFLLVENGILNEHAIVATLIIRFVTLWFAEIVGATALLIFSKRESLSLKTIKI